MTGPSTSKSRHAPCARCEMLPEAPPKSGTLYIWPPLGHTVSKVETCLRRLGTPDVVIEDGGVAVRVEQAAHTDTIRRLAEALTSEERRATKILMLPEGSKLSMSTFQHATTLDRYAAGTEAEWLVALLRQKQLSSWFQPIVRANDTSQLYAYEALLGATTNDGVIAAGRLFAAAKDGDLLFQLDLAARLSAIESHARLQLPHNVFINFSPASVYDPAYCLRRTVAAIQEAGITPDRIVFEVVESEETRDLEHLKAVLGFYRKQGFRVALDDVGSGFSSLNLIHELRPDFVKLDMGLTRNVHQDQYKALVVEKLLEITHGLGIQSVAEGIETADELAWVARHGADFVQGYLIARPSATPARSLEAIALP